MKAIVLEIKDDQAAVMKEDGSIITVKCDCQVGQTIELNEHKLFPKTHTTHRVLRLAFSMMIMIAVVAGISAHNYYNVSAASYVTIEAKTAIEYTLNRQGKVIAVTAIDQTGKKVVAEIKDKVKDDDIVTAITKTIPVLENKGCLTKGKTNEVVTSVVSKEHALTKKVCQDVKTCAKDNNDVNIDVVEATMKDKKEAEKKGISTCKYALIKKLKTSTSSTTTSSTESSVDEEDVKKYEKTSSNDLLKQTKKSKKTKKKASTTQTMTQAGEDSSTSSSSSQTTTEPELEESQGTDSDHPTKSSTKQAKPEVITPEKKVDEEQPTTPAKQGVASEVPVTPENQEDKEETKDSQEKAETVPRETTVSSTTTNNIQE